jgi:DNA-binding transcriptional LysR family regulator
MDLRKLETFYYASKLLNYSKAAEELNFTQPAVSKQIKALENEIGCPLFLRIGNKLHLTPTGEIIQKYAVKMFEIMEELKSEIKARDHAETSLKIGADISFITNNLQPVFAEFYRTNPHVQIKISVVNSVAVISKILDNKLDVGFVSGEYEYPQITTTLISEDPIVLVASSNIIGRYKAGYIKQKYPLIVYQASSVYSQKVREFIDINRLRWPHSIEFSDLEAVKSAILQDVGVAVITTDVVHNELASGALVVIDKNFQPVTISTYMIHHSAKKDWASIQSFRQSVMRFWLR